MELACRIVKRKITVNKPESIINNIKNLNIMQYIDKSPKKFLRKTKKRCLPVFNYVANSLFYDHDNDMGHALLLAYYISTYSD